MGALVVQGLFEVLLFVGFPMRKHIQPFACEIKPLRPQILACRFVGHVHGIGGLPLILRIDRIDPQICRSQVLKYLCTMHHLCELSHLAGSGLPPP